MNAQSYFTHILLIALLIPGTCQTLQGADKTPESNAEIMFSLSRETVNGFCADAKIPDTTAVNVDIENGEVNRFFTQPLVESFRQHFISLYTHSGTSSIAVLVSVAEVGVMYGEPFSGGFFSSRKSERTVAVALRYTATRTVDGKVLWAGTKRGSSVDTVYVDEIPNLQESSKFVATGAMPDHSAFERFIEPLIIAGAAGIAVYLFFTIRS
ncbi:MAG: hypothetical protein WBZ48_00955 [Bacteroidota bacterium]